MPAQLKSVLQYLVMILVTVALLWLSLRGIPSSGEGGKMSMLWSAWQESNKAYLLLMAVIMMISHFLRAVRWQMLLHPTGNRIRLSYSFLSVLIGYLVNLAIPRGGEVSRCYNLYRLEGTPVETSFGTVVVERIVDLISLALLILISFIIEWERLEGFMAELDFGSQEGYSAPLWVVGALIALGALAGALFMFRKNQKLRKLLLGFKEGLTAVFRVRNKILFAFHSIVIWVLYYFMSYCVLLAFEQTSHLGFSAVLTIFAIGAIAMAAPLPGGAGSYHVLLPLGLVSLYSLPRPEAVAFVFIFHAWQTFVLVVAGVVSLIASYMIIRWKTQPTK